MKNILFTLFLIASSLIVCHAQHYYLFGEATAGGIYGKGVLFRFDPFTGKDTILFNFNDIDGSTPGVCLSLNQNKIIYGICGYGGSSNDGVLFSYNLSNGIENTIFDFDSSNGASPGGGGAGMIFYNGNLYGTTYLGGKYNDGVIFRYNPISNKDTVVFSFNGADGKFTDGGLFILNDTSIFGMSTQGGLHNNGVIYRFNLLKDTAIVLFNFNESTDGTYPGATFTKDSNGLLYGMTPDFGPGGGGTLFSFNLSTNTKTTLVNFNGTNGEYPFGDLFLATNGLLYGMTEMGGSKNDGVLFSYNVNTNSYNIILNFDSINGKYPDGCNLIEDTINKTLYGMTTYGGKYNDGVIFSYNIITDKDSVLLNFNGTNGAIPSGTLLMIPDSLLGINELRAKGEEVRVVPNPNDGIFQLVISNEQLVIKSTVEIYNMLGQEVYSNSYQPIAISHQPININLSSKPSGIYLYRVITVTGELVGEGKFVIEK